MPRKGFEFSEHHVNLCLYPDCDRCWKEEGFCTLLENRKPTPCNVTVAVRLWLLMNEHSEVLNGSEVEADFGLVYFQLQ